MTPEKRKLLDEKYASVMAAFDRFLEASEIVYNKETYDKIKWHLEQITVAYNSSK